MNKKLLTTGLIVGAITLGSFTFAYQNGNVDGEQRQSSVVYEQLTQEQQTALDAMREEHRVEMEELIGSERPFGQLTDEQKAQMDELRDSQKAELVEIVGEDLAAQMELNRGPKSGNNSNGKIGKQGKGLRGNGGNRGSGNGTGTGTRGNGGVCTYSSN